MIANEQPYPDCYSAYYDQQLSNQLFDFTNMNKPFGVENLKIRFECTQPRVDVPAAEDAIRRLLVAIGEDPRREGIRETPRRVAKLWREFIEYDAGKTDTAFEQRQTDQMVVVSGVRVWSMCEHHLLPFWCDVTIGYIADGKVLGLSKMARIAERYAHRLQLQEQLVTQIADEMRAVLESHNVAVIATGEHLCMTMRGVRKEGLMTSSSMHGVFRHNPAARSEFLRLSERTAR